MLSERDRLSIVELAEKYHAKRVLLFGSSAQPNREARDIDIAVEGIPPGEFFRFYGDLIFTGQFQVLRWFFRVVLGVGATPFAAILADKALKRARSSGRRGYEAGRSFSTVS